MKKILTLTYFAFIIISMLNAQQQIPNASFEDWEDVGVGTDEPTHWSSIKTSDNLILNSLAPVVWDKSTDAHSGNYSVKLFDVATIGIVATGTITNGRLHSETDPSLAYAFTDVNDARWHTVFTQRPDSLVGWFKCNPSIGDFGTVKFLLHKGYAQLPGDESNYIGIAYYELPEEDITVWSRFSVPFIYTSDENPDYFLSVITAGNGTMAVNGSTALFDDFKFIYNPSSVNEISENRFKVIVSNRQLKMIIDYNNNQSYSVMLVDINGRTVLTDKFAAGDDKVINISSLSPGIYVAVASSPLITFTKKVIIQ